MYRTQENLWRGHTNCVGRGSSKGRGATWDEQTQVELHENLRAKQNRSRFGLGFVPNGSRASVTSAELHCTGRPSVSSSSSNGSSTSFRHSFACSEHQHAAVEQRAGYSSSRTKPEGGTARSRSRHNRGVVEQLERSNRLSDRSSRKRSKHRSRSHSSTHTEQRKRRSRSRTSEASLPQKRRDAAHRHRRDNFYREVRVEENTQTGSQERHRTDAGETKTEEVSRRTLDSQGGECERKERREGISQKHSSRRSTSDGTHGTLKRRSPSYSRERFVHAGERSSCEKAYFRKPDIDTGMSSISSRSARSIKGGPSSSEKCVRRADVQRKGSQSLLRTEEERRTRHRECCRNSYEEDRNNVLGVEKSEEETSSRSSSYAAFRKDQNSFRKDERRNGTDSGRIGEEARKRRDSQVRRGSQRGEARSHEAVLSNYGDEEKSKQYVGDDPVVTARDARENSERRGGTVRGRTTQLPSFYHGSAEDVLKQRIYERIRICLMLWWLFCCGFAELAFRNLSTWKHLITSESREAFETDDSRGNWNAILDRQDKEQLYEDTRRIVEHEDETRFTAFLEMKRREKLQADAIRKAALTHENGRTKDHVSSDTKSNGA